MALADAFDMAYALKHDIETIVKQNVPIVILTDSLSLRRDYKGSNNDYEGNNNGRKTTND
jgi:hypothetical protein